MSFVIGADIVPTVGNMHLFQSGNIKQLVGDELLDFLSRQDYRIFNLETPLCDLEHPIDKYGANIRTPVYAINAMKKLDINAFTLANNHIFDQGEKGLMSTLKVLSDQNINYFGVGETKENASLPFYFLHRNKKIGVYGCCEQEFCSLNDEKYTANVFSPLYSFEQIKFIKQKCDYLIILYHGGKELYRYPTPRLQTVCRLMIDAGADLVICQHSHCIGSSERYREATIVYGQGNFIFDAESNEYWDSGMLVQVTDDYEIKYTPFVKKNGCIHMADLVERKHIMDAFETRSKQIVDESFVKERFDDYCLTVRNSYLSMLTGEGKKLYFRLLNRITNHRWSDYYIKKKYDKKNTPMILNLIKCDTHREILINLLENEEGRHI